MKTDRSLLDGRATIWIGGIDTQYMNEQLAGAQIASEAFQSALDGLGISEAGAAALNISGAYQFANEVNHRPAAQQWAVCTPQIRSTSVAGAISVLQHW